MSGMGASVLSDRQVEIASMNFTRLSREERYQIFEAKKAVAPYATLPPSMARRGFSKENLQVARLAGLERKEPELHNDYGTGAQYGDGKIEQSIPKETWISDSWSGILQFRRCAPYLNSQAGENVVSA